MRQGLPQMRRRVPQDGRHGLIASNDFYEKDIPMTSSIKFSRIVRAAALAAASTLLVPLAQAQMPAKPASAMPAMAASSSMAMPASGMDMKSMMKDMSDKMSSMAMSGNMDVDFAMMMRVHHQGAIDMAQVELKSGKEPKMQKMARDIVAAQKKEIAEIDKFLASRGNAMDKMKK